MVKSTRFPARARAILVGQAFPLEEIVAIRHRVTPHARFDGAVAEGGVDAAWQVRFLGAFARHAVFRRLWLGALAGSVGQWMQQVALGWLAIGMTNSPGFVGIVTFAAGLPFLVVAPFGGSLIDRIDRRRLMLNCQVLAFSLAAVLALDVTSGVVQPWHLPIAAFLNGSLQALLIPTQQSLVPALVPREDLTNAVGLMSTEQTPEPEPASVTPREFAYRSRDAANERRLAKGAERRAAATPRCATCDTLSEPGDNFCARCGSPLGEPAPVATRPAPVAAPATIAAYSPKNQERMLAACPHATEVRTFNGRLAAGRVVVKGQKGIRLVASDTMDDGKITSIKPVSVFDVTQTQERTPRLAAA